MRNTILSFTQVLLIIISFTIIIIPVSGRLPNADMIFLNENLPVQFSAESGIFHTSLSGGRLASAPDPGGKTASAVGITDKSHPVSLFVFQYDNSRDAWTAVNEDQSLNLLVTSKSVIQITNEKGTIGMQLAGIGREENLLEVPDGIIRVEGDRLEIIRDTETEWYLNKNTGLEQGMTLAHRRSGNGDLRISFNLFGTLTPTLEHQTLVYSDGNEPVIYYSGLTAVDVTGRILPSAMILNGTRLFWNVDDRNAVYPLTIDPVLSQAKILSVSDVATINQFGTSVSISNDTAIVGAQGFASYRGQAYIFQKDVGGTDRWGQVAILNASDKAANAIFGYTVSISNDTAIVGAYMANSGGFSSAGQAYVFQKDTGGTNRWGQVAILNASDRAAQASFGISVSLSNDTAIIGAMGAKSGGIYPGQAYIFQKNAGGANRWGQVAILNASDKAQYDCFGRSVSISNDTVIVGTERAATGGFSWAGKAYIFQKDEGGSDRWGQVAILNASDKAAQAQFGYAVSLSNDTAVVGAWNAPSGALVKVGQAYVFRKDEGGADRWGQVKILNASDKTERAGFGYSVNVADDTIIVGAYNASLDTVASAGQAYVFRKDMGGADRWGQYAILNASDKAASAKFGNSVCILNDTALVGSYNFKIGELWSAGQAYIFTPEPAPVANFTSNVTSGTTPLAVQFTDTSTNTPTGWMWNAINVTGNNTPFAFSTTQNPAQVFGIGNFSIYLTATNSMGSNVSTQSRFINVTAQLPTPIANFIVNKTNGTAPLSVQFTDTSTDSPTGWAWFFGDETYTQPWMRQNASAGWSARRWHSSIVKSDGSIVLSGGCDSGDGKNDTWRSPDNGLTWTQQSANAGWLGRMYHTSVAMPDGSIVLSGGGRVGSPYMNDTWRSTDNGVTWTQQNASAGWSARSFHTSVVMPDGSIVLMGGLAGSSDWRNDTWRSTDKGITWTQVNASAQWSGRYMHSSVVMPDGSIVLLGGWDSSGYKNDVWRSTDNGLTWTRQTANAGWSVRRTQRSVAMPDSSIVLMGGYDSTGYKNDVWRSTDNGISWVQVNASAGWTARIYHTSVAMPDGSVILMGGQNSSMYMNDTWRFVPTGSSVQNPSHTYTKAGVYPVTLQVFNPMGFNISQKMGYISVTEPVPVSGFTTNVTYGSAPLFVNFTDISTNTPTGWIWNATNVTGNNTPFTFSTSQNPTQVFGVGNFSIKLKSANSGGYNISTQITFINLSAPLSVANFTSNITQGGYNLTIKFTDQSTEIPVFWNWSFGDGTYSTAQHPVHTYAQIEDKQQWYNVSLNVTNAFGSNTTKKTRYIHLMSFSEYYRSISDPAGNISTSTFVGIIEDWRLQRSVPTFTVAPSTSIFVGLIEDWRLQRPLS